MQMAEKERFLGHQPSSEKLVSKQSVDNKASDINFNPPDSIRTRTLSVGNTCTRPEIPPKTSLMKSTEGINTLMKSSDQLNTACEGASEKFNGNAKSSHTRTQSDGE